MARLLKTTPDTSQIGLKVLKHLITPSWYDKDGKTALQIAESAGQEAAIKYLEAWVCCPKKRCPPPFYRFQFLWSESTLSELFTYVFEGAQCMPDLATIQIWSNLCVSLNLWKLKSLALINMQRWEEYSLAHRTWLKLLPQRAKTRNILSQTVDAAERCLLLTQDLTSILCVVVTQACVPSIQLEDDFVKYPDQASSFCIWRFSPESQRVRQLILLFVLSQVCWTWVKTRTFSEVSAKVFDHDFNA